MLKLLLSLLSLGSFATLHAATPYATYNADINQQAADPTTQGWSITGRLHQGVEDRGTLAWELKDQTSAVTGPTMMRDYGEGNLPQPGDSWAFTVNARVHAGNGQPTNAIMWSDGNERYLFFVFEDGTGQLDLLFWDTEGQPETHQNIALNDHRYHDWAIVHDGTKARVTYDGRDLVRMGSIPAQGTPRGVHIGGGSSRGVGALSVARASYVASLAKGPQSTRLGRVFSDHMVLQRDEPLRIFGHDPVNPGSQRIEVSFAGQSKQATTDAEGKWFVTLDPMAANAYGRDLLVRGSSEAKLRDVLLGEVWLAAGQSNMNHTVSASRSINTPDPEFYPLIRMCNWEGTVGTGSNTVYRADDFSKLTPEHFYAGRWQVIDSSAVLPQSAVAYYFAQNLAAKLRVPIGMVDISYGGTSTEAYISPATCLAHPRLREAFRQPHLTTHLGQWTGPRIFKNLFGNDPDHYTHTDPAKPYPHPYAPGFLYETGLAHLIDFTFKGAIWYQGESNAEFTTGKYKLSGDQLSEDQSFVMKTMIADWRVAFARPRFPIYMVQLPRIQAPNRALWPYYREAQARVAREIDQVELALVMEYGSKAADVHPPDKAPVGKRLAAIARAKLYGEDIVHSGPVYRGHAVFGSSLILEFDHVGAGLVDRDGGELRNFEVAGEDHKFVEAEAYIDGDTIRVSAESVRNPVAVRHAWSMEADVDLFNVDGFSASSFRTDQ